jgi:tRNA1Val (adenine37-N6)-methyltransferase
MMIDLKENERLDDLQRNGYQIIQNPEKFCFGMDAVLLAGFAYAGEGDKVLDLGTGTGIIPILMAARTKAGHFAGLEILAQSVDMARRSIALNQLTGRIDIIEGDIKEAGNIFRSASFDVITSNPPYVTCNHGLVNPDSEKAIARHEVLCTLKDVVGAASRLLKPGGHFFMVHRPFRLSETIVTLSRYKLEPKRMRLVYPYVDKAPNMVLLEAVRDGNAGMKVEKPLIVFKEPGVYMPEIYDIYGY